MHWFDQRVLELRQLARECQLPDPGKQGDIKPDNGNSRRTLRLTAEQLAEEVAAHVGVSACLVSYDGLPLAAAGHTNQLEAMAAVSQTCFQAAQMGGEKLGLGHPEQIVIVGEQNKFAMISMGELTLCILSPKNTVLTEILSTPPVTN